MWNSACPVGAGCGGRRQGVLRPAMTTGLWLLLAVCLGGCFGASTGGGGDGGVGCQRDSDCGALTDSAGNACAAPVCVVDAAESWVVGLCMCGAPEPEQAPDAGVPGACAGGVCEDAVDAGVPRPEQCNGGDDDLDGVIDEGALMLEGQRLVAFSGTADMSDVALDPRTGALGVGYSINGTRAGVSFAAADGGAAVGSQEVGVDVGDGAAPRRLVASALALSALDADSFVIAGFNRSGYGRMFAAVLPRAQAGEWTAHASAAQVRWGLACSPGEACAANTGEPEVPVAQPDTAKPVVASIGRNVLVAYQREGVPGPDYRCRDGWPEGAEPPRVLVNWLVQSRADGRRLEEPVAVALDLGAADTAERPAVVAWPGVGGAADSFLVGFVAHGGAIEVWQVHGSQAGPTVGDAPLWRVDGDARSSPSLAVGDDGSAARNPVLAVAFERDCVGGVALELLSVTAPAGGPLQATLHASRTELPGGRAPAVAFAPGLKQWGLAQRMADGVAFTTVSPDGIVSERTHQTLPFGADAQGSYVWSAPFLMPAPDDERGFFVVAGVDLDGERNVELVRVSACAE